MNRPEARGPTGVEPPAAGLAEAPGTRGTLARARLEEIHRTVLATARASDYAGYSKHDALNSPILERLAGRSRILRLAFIQAVMRFPAHIRPALGVRKARNAKGLALFTRALLCRRRLYGDEVAAEEARRLLDWLVEHPAPDFPWPCWGYPYPWQDVGFFAPRGFPNRVVTSFVVQALLDGYETLGESRYLEAASGACRFLLEAPKTLWKDETRRCVSYEPSAAADWIVLDVSALAGAAVARRAAIAGDAAALEEAGRLIRYVASKQTDYGAWYYAEPPSASHITHDNYHTGFILDALLEYGRASAGAEFREAYARGLEFYRSRLFEPDGAPRFMHDRKYPFDIHGAAQGILTFALADDALGTGCEVSERILAWTLAHMYEPETGWFRYQRRRGFRTRIRLLRWCQGWMSWAIARHLECCGGPS